MAKLKPKEKEFARKLIENNEVAGLTVREVYGIKDKNYARVKGHRLITNDNVSQEIEKVRESIADRIPDDLLVEKHLELLNKRDLDDSPDTQAVGKGLEMAYKIKKLYGDDEKPQTKSGNTYNIFFSKEIQDSVKELEDRIKEKLKHV